MNNRAMLLIMDGFGIAAKGPGNAISAAETPNLDKLMKTCPFTEISASGRSVGLPDGQMGNSEVGHTNMGAGRVVWQELSNISNQIEDGRFFENEDIELSMKNVKESGGALHLMGLLSDGGVHSHIDHLFALIDKAVKSGVNELYVHCILDGRDVPPANAEEYIEKLQSKLASCKAGKIASISGRYYAMDRDKRWERVSQAYDCYSLGEGRSADSPEELMKLARANGETDEFVLPGRVAGTPNIEDGDSIIFFNFRPDRAREITRCFTDPDFDGFERKKVYGKLDYLCFTTYDATIPNVRIAFKPQSLKNTLGEYVSAMGKTQLRIAETEKYAHVTFFFNGGIEEPYKGEERILVPSPKVATYDLQPEMSAQEVSEKVEEAIAGGKFDLIIMNLANCDMVGHTGVFDAAVKAVETVDACVGKIVQAALGNGYNLLITADHGNADEMLDESGNVITAHTSNPVPLILAGEASKLYGLKEGGVLSDLAPTLLELMGLEKPAEMSAESLLVRK